MSQSPQSNQNSTESGRTHWRTDDLYVGLIFLAIAVLFGVTALRTLVIGTPGMMGPGFFPLLVSSVLTAIALITILGARSTGPHGRPRPVSWRAVICVTAAPVVFALTVRTMGLVPALVFAVSLGVLASRKMTLVRGALIVIGMTAFCVAVFSYGIGLTIELFNPYFWGMR